VATYWLPVHNLLESDAKAILRGFCDAFADCSLWVGHDLDWMMVGSHGGVPRPSAQAFGRQWLDPDLLPELRRLGFERPAALGATFLGDADWLAARTAGSPPLRDAWPKRLSDRLQSDARATFGPWMNEAEARERFRSSAYIRALWPPELLAPTLAAFEVQARIAEVARGEAIPWPRRLRALDRLAGPPAWITVRGWLLGLTSDRLAAVDAALARGRPVRPHLRTLALRRLAEGDLPAAAAALEWAAVALPADPGLPLLEAYARCRADDREGGRQRLESLASAAPGVRAGARWLERSCGGTG
jgi:hypothetical protein